MIVLAETVIIRCDECLMKVHPECEDFDCSVCRETAAVVEARLVFCSSVLC